LNFATPGCKVKQIFLAASDSRETRGGKKIPACPFFSNGVGGLREIVFADTTLTFLGR